MAPTINVSTELYRNLGQFGNRDESWNDVVARLLEHVDKEAAKVDKENRQTTYNGPVGSITRGETDNDSPLNHLDDGTVLRHRYKRGNHSGATVEATVRNGQVEYNGDPYSPSRAALKADADVRGENAASSLNGWTWWEFENDDGDWVPIDVLRK